MPKPPTNAKVTSKMGFLYDTILSLIEKKKNDMTKYTKYIIFFLFLNILKERYSNPNRSRNAIIIDINIHRFLLVII